MPDQLTIARLHYETPNALGIGLAVPPALRDKFRFKAGQFILLYGDIEGEKISRSYSITSTPQHYADSHMLYIVVKKLKGGLFSNHLHGTLQLGDKVTASVPRGLFYWPLEIKEKTQTKAKTKAKRKPTRSPHYVAFAAGSGITPIMAVLKTILQNEPHARISLFYGNRTAADIIFHDALHDLKDMYMARFECFYLLSQQARDIELLSGRIDKARVKQFAKLQLFDPAQVEQFFICGPGEMISDIEAGLRALKVAADKIRTEKFIAQRLPQKFAPQAPQASQAKTKAKRKGGKRKPAGESAAPAGFASPVTLVDVIFDGTRKQIKLQDKDTNILDAAQEQGLKLPFSCRGGMCSTCRCKLTQGRVTMAANYCLEAWEIESGFVLACQAHPETAKITLNFDES